MGRLTVVLANQQNTSTNVRFKTIFFWFPRFQLASMTDFYAIVVDSMCCSTARSIS